MEFDQLKTGLFGYQKSSVYEYITALNEDFSKKLMEKDRAAKETETQYQETIEKLKEELAALRQECEGQKEEQGKIAATMMEAQRYAETVAKKAEERAVRERKDWEEELIKMHRELNQYYTKVATLRRTLDTLLHTMEQQAADAEDQILSVLDSEPKRNLSLFERKTQGKK